MLFHSLQGDEEGALFGKIQESLLVARKGGQLSLEKAFATTTWL